MDLLLKIIEILEKEYKEIKKYSISCKENNILDVLIATKLSQNTTDKTAYIAFNNLKRKYLNWSDLMNEDLEKIKKEIRICGMANTKSKDIKNILRKIYKKYNSFDLSFLNNYTNEQIYNELLSFKGVGLKTASCVLAFALGRDVFPVDTHIHRILNRIGLIKTVSPDKTFTAISDKIPNGKKLFLHRCLIRFGRSICRARNPLCNDCFLNNFCEYREKLDKSKTMSKKKNISKYNNFLVLENI
ncbi:MAG: endonuclease III [Ignavibacteria bacterium]|nr:endonuclease III [Ignavibacteria bacterium]